MMVDEEVFEALYVTRTKNKPISSPGAPAMIALKLHALNQPGRENKEKDWSDILAIIDSQSLNLDDPQFSAIVLKHGGEKAIARITAHLAG